MKQSYSQSSYEDAEAVIGEVAFLEATLRSTLEQRRGTPLAAIQGQKDQDLGYVLEAEPRNLEQVDVATANYAVRLKAWIDVQVDQRLGQVIQGVLESELVPWQQETSRRIATTTQAELERLRSAQSKLLEAVQSLSNEVDRISASLKDKETGAILTTLHNDVRETVDRVAMLHREVKETDAHLTAFRSEIKEVRDQLSNEMFPRIHKLQDLDAQVQDLDVRVQVCDFAKKSDTQEIDLEASVAAVKGDLLAAQKRLVSELRAETIAAFRSEAAAVAALDEQLWLTDQRLGQRIDELAHSYRESLAVVGHCPPGDSRTASASKLLTNLSQEGDAGMLVSRLESDSQSGSANGLRNQLLRPHERGTLTRGREVCQDAAESPAGPSGTGEATSGFKPSPSWLQARLTLGVPSSNSTGTLSSSNSAGKQGRRIMLSQTRGESLTDLLIKRSSMSPDGQEVAEEDIVVQS